jgi:hypothetical protein
LQLLIYGANLLSTDPIVLRWLMVLLGSMAGAAFYGLSSTLWGREAGFVCALLFVTNPLVIVHSLVPYQEILMVLLLCLGLWLLWQRESAWKLAVASLCLGLACLTRYEAWIITAVAALFYWRQHWAQKAVWKSLLHMVLLFGWAPLLWIFFQRGLSPSGTFVIEAWDHWKRLYRVLYILVMTAYHAGLWLSLGAVFGLNEFWNKGLWRNPRIQMLLVSLLVFLAALIFSAHGVPPDPIRYITDREAHWPLLFVIWFGGLGMYKLRKYSIAAQVLAPGRKRAALTAGVAYLVLIGLCVFCGLRETERRLVSLAAQPNLQLDYQVAKFLDKYLPTGYCALVLAEPISARAIQEYLDRAYERSGANGLVAARQTVAMMDTGPFDYSRIVVNSRVGKQRIMHTAQLQASGLAWDGTPPASMRFAIRFSNFRPKDERETKLDGWIQEYGRKLTELSVRELTAQIFELPW